MSGDWVSAIAAWVGAAAAWAAFGIGEYRRYGERFFNLRVHYEEKKRSRQLFWEEIRAAYSTHRAGNDTLPDGLDILAERAGLPPDVLDRAGRPLLHWPNENLYRLSADQSALWTFCVAVYPPLPRRLNELSQHTIVRKEVADSFHQARGVLANFWNNWADSVPRRQTELTDSVKYDLILLTWLDVALKQSVPEDRDAGKTALYRLADRVLRQGSPR